MSSKKKAVAPLQPLSRKHQKMIERQDEYIKMLREAPFKNQQPLSQEEVKKIGEAIGLWTPDGKLTRSYRK